EQLVFDGTIVEERPFMAAQNRAGRSELQLGTGPKGQTACCRARDSKEPLFPRRLTSFVRSTAPTKSHQSRRLCSPPSRAPDQIRGQHFRQDRFQSLMPASARLSRAQPSEARNWPADENRAPDQTAKSQTREPHARHGRPQRTLPRWAAVPACVQIVPADSTA